MRRILALALCAVGSCSTTQPDIYNHDLLAYVPAHSRTWLDDSLWANRLQDWRVDRGRIECVEGRADRPMRTVHCLTTTLGESPAAFEMSVLTAPLDPGAADATTWTGFLIGAGGDGIDYRITALCHHRPARDGGLVCAVDGTGRVVFRDNVHNEKPGSWGITGPLGDGELREIAATQSDGPGRGGEPLGQVLLILHGQPTGHGYTLHLRAHDGVTKMLLSEARLTDVDPRLVAGNVALVSHRGPSGSTRGYWFREWNLDGGKLESHGERAYGPILATQYTLSHGILKLTAQMAPLGEEEQQVAYLAVRREVPDADQFPGHWDHEWRSIASAMLERDSFTFQFRVDDWDSGKDVSFAVFYQQFRLPFGWGPDRSWHSWQGTIRAEPTDGEFVLAALSCNKNFTGGLQWNRDGVWFPHTDLVERVRAHEPDLLFFAGDQLYEGDITGAERTPDDKARLDYLDKWYRWCWAFGDLARDRPCICIPDDHDVYHGNLWGAGGRHAKRQDDGGYTMPARFVRMVERTQTSHLPAPYDPTPVEQGIGVYYTRLEYGGVSFAILEDRKWKSSPTPTVPDGNVVNGWFQNPDFDPRNADVAGAELLGQRQLDFLRDWSTDWSRGTWMKCALSQTIFANVATLPSTATSDGVVPGLHVFEPGDYAPNDKLVADCDSNGWPQTPRNAALRELRRGFALHIAGDQHLGSLTHYGVDDWDDAGFAFCVPAIGNTFPRRWFPPEPGGNQQPNLPKYTGRYLDGFGNHITVWAVSNPHRSGKHPQALHDRAPGYGIIRFNRDSREIVLECWPRWSDPTDPGAPQYPGWPKTIQQHENYDRAAVAWLPTLEVEGLLDPVVRLIDEGTGEIVYALRILGTTFRPKVFAEGTYTIEVGEPGTTQWTRETGIRSTTEAGAVLRVRF